MKRGLSLVLLSLIIIGMTGCSTLTMPKPQTFGSFGGRGEKVQRHSCMALVLAITKQQGWILRDVAGGCAKVDARASTIGADFIVDFVFTINKNGLVTVDVTEPKYTSSNGKQIVARWVNHLERTYSRYRTRSYGDLERYVGELCVE